jgi:hypothetical protein
MASNVSFNPLLMTTAQNTFNVSSEGYVQGVAMDDPAVRYALAGGILNATETLPIWGGVGIYEYIPGAAGAPADQLGSLVGRATTLGALKGFAVFNQAHAWITTPQSQCPSGGAGMTVPFYRLGSGARIAVQCDPALASLEGGLVDQQVSWDFGGQKLVQYNAAWNAVNVSAATYSAGPPASVTFTTASNHGIAVGEFFTVSGVSPAGYNTEYQAISGTTGTTLVGQLAGLANPGSYVSGGQVAAGGGALPCKVLGFNIGNSKVVTYDPVNNLVNWNNAGNTALILI